MLSLHPNEVPKVGRRGGLAARAPMVAPAAAMLDRVGWGCRGEPLDGLFLGWLPVLQRTLDALVRCHASAISCPCLFLAKTGMLKEGGWGRRVADGFNDGLLVSIEWTQLWRR